MFKSKLQQQNYNMESPIWEYIEGRSGKQKSPYSKPEGILLETMVYV